MEKMENKNEAPQDDMQMALFFIKHIEASCDDGSGHNLRDFYIMEAKSVLETMNNPEAKALLQEMIEKYKDKR